MSTTSGGSMQQFFIRGLINVPDYLRNLDKQAFTPLLISIGPIHRPNRKLQTMKACKTQFSMCFIKRVKLDLADLEEKIKDREKEIRSCYDATVVSDIGTDDFVTMIRVDGCFILEYFLRESNPYLEVDRPTARIAEWMPPFLKFDLLLLENQLPFFVLEMLYEEATSRDEWAELQLNPLPLKKLAFDFFDCFNFQKVAILDFEIEHFTDLIRLFYLGEGEEGLKDGRIFGGAKLSYSAIQLREAGVKFKKGVETDHRGFYEGNRCLLDIRFDLNSGVLEIPSIVLNAEKIRLIKNIIALEQTNYVGEAYVTDFFVFLDFLINTSKDVDLLCDKGILVNYLGKGATSAINNLNINIKWDYMNNGYSKICRDLNAFYKTPWHRWKAILRHQYFSTPWRAASTSAAIILLLLTAIQTVCSLRSTKW